MRCLEGVTFGSGECLAMGLRAAFTPALSATPCARVQLTGEATPSYMLSYDSAMIMASIVPDAKILVILRNPVDRMYSEYATPVISGRHGVLS